MSRKVIFRWYLIAGMAVVFLMLGAGTMSARAQCGAQEPSSCVTCHAQEDPVNEKGEWHIIHAEKDICINCHGGNATTMNKDLAHESLTANPLSDIYTDCHSCHTDYELRAQIFASTLGVTPGSCATPTPIIANTISNGPSSGGINSPINHVNAASSIQTILVIGTMLSILILFVFGIIWLERHHIPSKIT
jgi:hypothetical protein